MTAVQCVTQKTLCTNCGIPADSEYFDESGFADLPAPGNEVVLARFDLHHQYCGILECFSQYTDLFFANAAEAQTPGLEWLLLGESPAPISVCEFASDSEPLGVWQFLRAASSSGSRAVGICHAAQKRCASDDDPGGGRKNYGPLLVQSRLSHAPCAVRQSLSSQRAAA
jgi:hypothetical protein